MRNSSKLNLFSMKSYRYGKKISKRVKYAWQRITKGYCESDVWDLGDTILVLLKDMLIQLRDKHVGYPGRFTDEEWIEYLNEIIANLYSALYVGDDSAKYRKKAFELLDEVWEELWD